ncbi:MAG: copper homeostasis protein [Candidatus Paceibacteria bacterium]|jgi:copper homeostasis protein
MEPGRGRVPGILLPTLPRGVLRHCAMTRLEVCIDSVPAALDAAARGADRLEYCARLDQDGLTPDTTELRAVLDAVSIPVFAMVRPRPGNFVLQAGELEQMERDLDRVLDAGAQGIVLGALTERGTIDCTALERLLRAAGSTPVTFHRAFDGIAEPVESLEVLIELGVHRLLTSADGASAWEGRDLLAQLVKRAGDRCIVMPGGGVRQEHVAELILRTGATEVHSSKVLQLQR